MSQDKLPVLWFLFFSLVGVIIAACYIAFTGMRLRRKKEARSESEIRSHKLAVDLFFPGVATVLLVAVVMLMFVSGRFSPPPLRWTHLAVVAAFVCWYFVTRYTNGLKHPLRHRMLARRTGILFVIVTALGIWMGSHNPDIREAFALMFS